jgi:hypothetical protein
MSNSDVIDMASMGLSDSVIIEKIRNADVTNFDTNLDGLRLLKASRVPDGVIQVMINPKAVVANHAEKSVTTGDSTTASTLVPQEIGVYVVREKQLAVVRPEVAIMNTEPSGVMMSMLTYGAKHMSLMAKIENPSSSLPLSTTQQFVLRLPDGSNTNRGIYLTPPTTTGCGLLP